MTTETLSATLQAIVGDHDGCPIIEAKDGNYFLLDGYFTLEQLQELVLQVQASRTAR